ITPKMRRSVDFSTWSRRLDRRVTRVFYMESGRVAWRVRSCTTRGQKFKPLPDWHFRPPAAAGKPPKAGRRYVTQWGWLIIIRPVEEVERLPAELQIEPLVLAEARILPRAHIGLHQAWTNQRVAPLGSKTQRPGRKVHKRARVGLTRRIAAVDHVAGPVARII